MKVTNAIKMELTNIRKNIMGTISFDLKVKGMRKTQDFIVYPAQGKSIGQNLTIQSDTRIGYLNLDKKTIRITKGFPGGAYFYHISLTPLSEHDLPEDTAIELELKILGTHSKEAGSSYVTCDNSIAEMAGQ